MNEAGDLLDLEPSVLGLKGAPSLPLFIYLSIYADVINVLHLSGLSFPLSDLGFKT